MGRPRAPAIGRLKVWSSDAANLSYSPKLRSASSTTRRQRQSAFPVGSFAEAGELYAQQKGHDPDQRKSAGAMGPSSNILRRSESRQNVSSRYGDGSTNSRGAANWSKQQLLTALILCVDRWFTDKPNCIFRLNSSACTPRWCFPMGRLVVPVTSDRSTLWNE